MRAYERVIEKQKGKKKKEFKAEYMKQLAEDTSTLESMAIGAGKSIHSSIEGIKQLLQGDDYEESQFAPGEGYAALKEESPWAVGGGEVISDIAQMALPGGAVTKGLKAAGKVKGAGIIGDLIGGMAVAGSKHVGEGESRTKNVTSDALATIAGGAAGKAIGKVASGSKLVKGAREYMDRGGNLTAGQAADGGVARGLDRFSRLIPGVPPGMEALENAAKKEWHVDALKHAALPGTTITKTGKEGLEQVSEGFTKAYKEAWAGATYKDVNPKGLMDDLDAAVGTLYKQDDQTALKAIIKDLEGKITALKGSSSDVRGAYYDVIDKTLNAAKIKAQGSDSTTLAANLSDGLSSWRKNLPDSVKGQLAKIDEHYPKFLVVDKAGFSAADKLGHFSPAQATTAYKSVSGRDAWRKSEAALQDIIETGNRTVGRVDDIADPGFLRKFSRDFPGFVPKSWSKGVMDPFIGNSWTQKGMRKIDKIRKGKPDSFVKGGIDEIISGGRLGAALNDSDIPGFDKEGIDLSNDLIVKLLGLTTDKKEKRKRTPLF